MELRKDFLYREDQPHGWYVHRSVILSDVVPELRNAGGGVTEDKLHANVNDAIDEAIIFCELKLHETAVHIKKLNKLRE